SRINKISSKYSFTKAFPYLKKSLSGAACPERRRRATSRINKICSKYSFTKAFPYLKKSSSGAACPEPGLKRAPKTEWQK
ncbi:MAG: hypothetical protein WCD31_01775, partial [Gillisia sp.]